MGRHKVQVGMFHDLTTCNLQVAPGVSCKFHHCTRPQPQPQLTHKHCSTVQKPKRILSSPSMKGCQTRSPVLMQTVACMWCGTMWCTIIEKMLHRQRRAMLFWGPPHVQQVVHESEGSLLNHLSALLCGVTLALWQTSIQKWIYSRITLIT